MWYVHLDITVKPTPVYPQTVHLTATVPWAPLNQPCAIQAHSHTTMLQIFTMHHNVQNAPLVSSTD